MSQTAIDNVEDEGQGPSALPKIALSVAIISRNTCDVLRDCIATIPVAAGGLEHEIIVVDNDSTDGSVEMVRNNFPDVRLIANTENLGFPKAVNQGICESSGRYIAILNADILPPQKALQRLVEHMDAKPAVAAAGPQLMGRDGRLQYSGGYAPSPAAVLRQLTGLNTLMGNRARGLAVRARSPKRVMSVDWLCGACLVVRGQAIDDVGGFDESVFMYAEDVEYGLRLRKSGWQLHLVPWVRVIHYGGLSGAGIAETELLWLGAIFRIAAKNLSPAAYKAFGLLESAEFFSRYILSAMASALPGRHGIGAEVARPGDFRKYAGAAFRLSMRGPEYVSQFCAGLEKGIKRSGGPVGS
ncbi:MAG: glycosyltransferase family 2 protein [Thermoleophilia bacterium]